MKNVNNKIYFQFNMNFIANELKRTCGDEKTDMKLTAHRARFFFRRAAHTTKTHE